MSYETQAEKAVTAKVRKALLARRLEDEAVIQNLMRTTAGRRWVHDKLAAWGIGQTPWVPDPYAASFNCGKQNAGLELWSDVMSAAPNEYIQMMKENSNAPGTDALPDASGDPSDSDTGDA